MISLSNLTHVGIETAESSFGPKDNLVRYFKSSAEMAGFIKRWYKTNFPDMAEHQIHMLLHLQISHLKSKLYMFGRKNITITELNRLFAQLSSCQNASIGNYSVTKESCEDMNLEFLIAMYLARRETKKKLPKEFISLLLEMIRNMHIEFSLDLLCEMKSDLVSRLLQVENSNFSYSFLKDPHFRKGNINYITSNYSFEELRSVFFNEVPRMYKRFSTKLFAECQFLAQNLTIDEYIVVELNRPLSYAYFNQSASSINSNPAILHYVFELYRKNAFEDLSNFSNI